MLKAYSYGYQPSRLTLPRRGPVAALAVVLLPVLTLTALRIIVEDKPEVHAFSFAPSTDWYVSAEAPDRAFNDRWLRTGNSTRHHAQTYLRFQVDGVTGDVSRVTLRVHAASANRGGFLVVAVPSDAWPGHATTYRDALPLGPVIGSSGPIDRPGWVAADLDLPLARQGPVLLTLVAASTASARYASGETGETAPRLVIETTTGDNSPRVPASGPAPPAGADRTVRVVAAGDIACDPTAPTDLEEGPTVGPRCRQQATSDMALSLRPDAVLPLGDNAYTNGSLANYRRWFEPTWGRLDRISHPVPGNHEYITSAESVGGAGYFAYFRARAGEVSKGWYSFDLGGWHLIALNGECPPAGSCGPGSPQERWLRADLAAHAANTCVLAYWHEPRFSSGWHGNDPRFDAFWDALYRAGAEIVLNGHDHDYERFAPQDPDGRLDPAKGIRQFVVGTGGGSLRQFRTVQPNSEVRGNSSLGVLQLDLQPEGYSWRFVPAAGGSFTDSGAGSCR
jgi:hypothetical protein